MNGPRIPANQIWMALGAAILLQAYFPLPRNLSADVSTAAPWAILAAGALAFLLFWPVAAALARRPGQNLVDVSLAAGGRPLAVLAALALGAAVLWGAGNGTRMAAEMVVTWFLPHTPQTFAMVALVAVAALGAALAPPDLVWIGAVAFWPAVIAICLVMVGNLGWGQFGNVQPATGPGLLPVAGLLLPLTSHFGEVIYLAVISRHLAAPRHLVWTAAKALGAAAALLALVVLVYLMVFPLPGGLAVPFPLLEMTRLVRGGRYLERVDALYITFWAFGTAGKVAGSVQAVALLLKDAFRLPDHRGAVLPLSTAVLALALIPANQAAAVAFEGLLVRHWSFLPTLLLPLGLVLWSAVRRRGGARG